MLTFKFNFQFFNVFVVFFVSFRIIVFKLDLFAIGLSFNNYFSFSLSCFFHFIYFLTRFILILVSFESYSFIIQIFSSISLSFFIHFQVSALIIVIRQINNWFFH
jgi:hypothetical protein